MFHHIDGIVSDIEPNLAVIDCGGIGFALNATTNTLSRLKSGERARLFVQEIIREDSFDLYGFFDRREKSCFEMLLGVSGVGPKAAMAILSATTPEGLAMAIIGGDEKTLTAAPGIGKKIAQRILLELKDKMSKETDGVAVAGGVSPVGGIGKSKLNDAVAALAVLGYGSSEISAMLKGIDLDALPLEEIIRLALRNMIK